MDTLIVYHINLQQLLRGRGVRSPAAPSVANAPCAWPPPTHQIEELDFAIRKKSPEMAAVASAKVFASVTEVKSLLL